MDFVQEVERECSTCNCPHCDRCQGDAEFITVRLSREQAEEVAGLANISDRFRMEDWSQLIEALGGDSHELVAVSTVSKYANGPIVGVDVVKNVSA